MQPNMQDITKHTNTKSTIGSNLTQTIVIPNYPRDLYASALSTPVAYSIKLSEGIETTNPQTPTPMLRKDYEFSRDLSTL